MCVIGRVVVVWILGLWEWGCYRTVDPGTNTPKCKGALELGLSYSSALGYMALARAGGRCAFSPPFWFLGKVFRVCISIVWKTRDLLVEGVGTMGLMSAFLG